MMRQRIRLVAAIAASLTGLAGLPAIAGPAPDTSFIRGYDEEVRALVFGVEALDDTEALCSELGAGGDAIDLEVSEDGLTATVAGEAGVPDDDQEVMPIVGADECTLNVVDATGPNGQVNHGTIVSSFVKALKELDLTGQGKGCLVRHIAQSDWGKGDQQVRTGDVEDTESAENTETPETGEPNPLSVMFEIDPVDCVHGKADRSEDDGPGNSAQAKEKKAQKGKPDHAGNGKPDHAGKSSDSEKGRPESPGSQGNGKNKN